MTPASEMTNLWIVSANGMKDFKVWHLFTIMDYKNRKRQITFCILIILLIILWSLAYLLLCQFMLEGQEFHIKVTSFLPCISFILIILARRAIKADEALVRAADRIR